ncbi:RNA polymerase sigma factor SigJ [Paraglaciecola sp.]|uniref:RNA polymerase sigma factor SigJ n=1 Tax=Paraglaciecola sp. TaxID=1920173 RepID=UPI0030F4222B
MKNNNSKKIDGINLFEEARPSLLGLAYRILGSMADAEDVVQDTFIKWDRTEQQTIETPKAWLTTVCTRCSLDQLRSVSRTRVDYIGTWLPEPIHTSNDSELITSIELGQSLTTAFLLMLERLTPKERAAYLLYEIFDNSYADVAHILQIKEMACRKLVSRAKSNIDQTKIRNTTSVQKQKEFLNAFQLAVTNGEIAELTTLLARDIKLNADGGGKVPSIIRPIEGRESVIEFIVKSLNIYWANCQWEKVDINNSLGFSLKEENNITAILSFSYDKQDQVDGIFIVRNPEKINNFDEISIH